MFTDYVPAKARVQGAVQHPTRLVESTALASIPSPNPTYKPHFPDGFIQSGALSDAQIEQVVYSGQSHEKTLPDGHRAGYFVGDGTGVGKGRIISGIFLDNYMQGRRKAVWISKTAGLAKDAQRDISDVFKAADLESDLLIDTTRMKAGGIPSDASGIAFLTYSGLSQGNPGLDGTELRKTQKPTRIANLVKWFGKNYDGVIFLDEVHLAGNAVAMKGKRGMKKPSKRALSVVDLQRALPNARIVYLSATGATDVTNLSYADRLGIWGPGQSFSSKQDFFSKIQSAGLSAMEVVAQNLKAMGRYLARTLSFEGVGQEQLTHAVTTEQKTIYNETSKAWQMVMASVEETMIATGAQNNSKARSSARSALFGAQQRFYNQILTAMQMPSVINQVEQDLKNELAVVFQIVNTNEATQERAIAKATAEDEDLDLESLDLSPKDILLEYVSNSYPTSLYEPVEDGDGNVRYKLVRDEKGNPVEDPDAVAAKNELLTQLAMLKTPENPIEMILNHFGAENVAEITGRSRRIVYKRNDKGEMEKVIERRSVANRQVEADEFQNDRRRILIFSDAGGTGFSFHADLNKPNKRRRIHYLLQAGWRADGALQGFGRTHRSNQAIAPLYKLVSTDINGHKRFISTIARRLAQLGALTSGERKASSGLFNEKHNLENDYAEDAVETLFSDLYSGRIEGMDFIEVTKKLGYARLEVDEQTGEKRWESTLVDPDTGGLHAAKIPQVTQFLNRILMMEIDEQNQMFDAFMERLEHRVDQAQFDGTFDPGLQSLDAIETRLVSDDVVYTHKDTGAEASLVEIEADTEIQLREWDSVSNAKQFVVNKKSGALYAIYTAPPIRDARTGAVVDALFLVNPDGKRRKEREYSISTDKAYGHYTELSKSDAQKRWQKEYDEAPKVHTKRHTFIRGVFLPVWDRTQIRFPKIYKVSPVGERPFLGIEVPDQMVARVRKRLGAGSRSALTPEQVFHGILDGGQSYELANGWKLLRSRVAGEQRIEVSGLDYNDIKEFESYIGGYMEKQGYQPRFFISTSQSEGVESIRKLTDKSPVVLDDDGSGPQFSLRDDDPNQSHLPLLDQGATQETNDEGQTRAEEVQRPDRPTGERGRADNLSPDGAGWQRGLEYFKSRITARNLARLGDTPVDAEFGRTDEFQEIVRYLAARGMRVVPVRTRLFDGAQKGDVVLISSLSSKDRMAVAAHELGHALDGEGSKYAQDIKAQIRLTYPAAMAYRSKLNRQRASVGYAPATDAELKREIFADLFAGMTRFQSDGKTHDLMMVVKDRDGVQRTITAMQMWESYTGEGQNRGQGPPQFSLPENAPARDTAELIQRLRDQAAFRDRAIGTAQAVEGRAVQQREKAKSDKRAAKLKDSAKERVNRTRQVERERAKIRIEEWKERFRNRTANVAELRKEFADTVQRAAPPSVQKRFVSHAAKIKTGGQLQRAIKSLNNYIEGYEHSVAKRAFQQYVKRLKPDDGVRHEYRDAVLRIISGVDPKAMSENSCPSVVTP